MLLTHFIQSGKQTLCPVALTVVSHCLQNSYNMLGKLCHEAYTTYEMEMFYSPMSYNNVNAVRVHIILFHIKNVVNFVLLLNDHRECDFSP